MPDYEDSADFTLVLEEDVLKGKFVHSRIGSAQMTAVRPGGEAEVEPRVVDFSRPRPETVQLEGLEEELAGAE